MLGDRIAALRTFGVVLALPVLLTLVAACTDVSVSEPLTARANQTVETPRKFLPYGVRIAETESLSLAPEPYDPVRHGPALPNSQPEMNLVGRPGFVLPARGTPAALGGGISQLSALALSSSDTVAFHGGHAIMYNWNPPTKVHGMSALHDVQRDVVLPPCGGWGCSLLYAPTLYPAGPAGSCIEVSTGHVNGLTENFHFNGFFDWCADTNRFQSL